MTPLGVLSIYCVLVAVVSFAAGRLPDFVRLTHRRMQMAVSFVGAFMLGVALLHMLPHAAVLLGDVNQAAVWMLGGVMLTYFLLRAFHFHQHGPGDVDVYDVEGSEEAQPHSHAHQHEHALGCDHVHDMRPVGAAAWTGLFIGLSLHTLIDGAALAAAVQADHEHHIQPWLWGLGTFAAVLLHKPLDAIGITSLMAAGGWSSARRNLVNACFAAMCPVGAALMYFGVSLLADDASHIVGRALALAAGVFLCISLADLLPEIELHSHDRIRLSLLLVAGVIAAWCIGFLEPDHLHGHGDHGDEASHHASTHHH